MKENKKQILKVSICTLMALVLFAGVILMCIYFAFDNTTNGVANAYTDEQIGVNNLFIRSNEGFYLKNFNDNNLSELAVLVDYFCYYIYGLDDSSTYIEQSYYDVGSFHLRYKDTSNLTRQFVARISFDIYKESDSDILNIKSHIVDQDGYQLNIFDLYYNYGDRFLESYTTDFYIKHDLSTDYYSYISITDSIQLENTFANQISSFIGIDTISSISQVSFNFVNFANLGCLISVNTSFAYPPVVMPEGVYNDNLQDKYDEGVASQEQTIEDLQNQINQNNALIEELREEIRYYESLDLNMSLIDVFNPARMKSSTFVYDGVTYTSNSIVSTDDGWDVYSTTYNNQELPPNYGVGFSLFLPEYITNTKFYVYGDITGWYNYTYCSEPDEQGNQQCYQVSDMVATISVGYRNQNGNIVKVGTFISNLPGAGGVDFFIDSPTNEIVFFVENCNLMEVDRNTEVIYYYFDTESIYNDGYENGKSQGINIGREEGYYEGVADANDYSFFSLFTSVFDAPITAIVGKWGDSDGDGVYQREGGMLNFYIPGLDINFAPFLLSLFTIAIIILVIRFVMARKS